jgi:hypothetical protein
MADGGVRVYIDTQELGADVMADLFALKDKYGTFIFTTRKDIETSQLTPPELPKDKERKSPSQRLHSNLFVLWDKMGRPGDDFDQFYKDKVNAYIIKIQETIKSYE